MTVPADDHHPPTQMATTEYEVGVYITLFTSTYVLKYREESILKAKVFMRGKKMGWVRHPRLLHLHMLIPTTEVLCESAKLSLPTSSLSAQYPFLFSGRAMETLTTRKFIYAVACPRCSCVVCSWEPFKSFENSGEGLVDRFWERVDTRGRDVDSIEGWTNGEEVFPTGPPRMSPFIEHCPLVIYCSSRPKGQATER
jgi:hypothetical protein